MCAAGACTGGAEPLILNIICILRERDGHGMTTFIMGHGQYKGPDTFVPIGMLVGVYADVDTYLAMNVGMAVLAQEGGYKSAYSYSSTEDKISGIHNYKIDPLTAPEYQKMIAVNSQKNNIIYIGYEGNYEGGTYLCTGDYSTCHDGRHGCTGILGQVKDTDVRLAFCILPTSRLGMATMTDRLPEEGEYASANQNLAEWQEKAKIFYEKIRKQEDPGKDIKEFNAWAVQNNKNQREAAFILSSYRPLEEFLALYEARMQRQSLGAGPFLSYLNGLPEETRDLVSKGLREEQRSGGSNQNQDGQSVSDKFIESFFMASTQERYNLWNSLSEDERATVRGTASSKTGPTWSFPQSRTIHRWLFMSSRWARSSRLHGRQVSPSTWRAKRVTVTAGVCARLSSWVSRRRLLRHSRSLISGTSSLRILRRRNALRFSSAAAPMHGSKR